jgi:hypothetical protein
MGDFLKKSIYKNPDSLTNNITIRLTANGYIIIGKDENKELVSIEEVYSHSYNFENLLNSVKNEVENYKNSKTNFIFTADEFTIVPEEYFQQNNFERYFSHVLKNNDIEKYHFIYTKQNDKYLLSAINKELFNLIKDSFATAEIYSDSELFFSASQKTIAERNSESVHLFFLKNMVKFLSFDKEANTLLYSQWEYDSMENLLYFVLKNVMHTQSTTQIDLFMCGEVERESNLTLSFSKYFNKIHFASNISHETEWAKHKYFIELSI